MVGGAQEEQEEVRDKADNNVEQSPDAHKVDLVRDLLFLVRGCGEGGVREYSGDQAPGEAVLLLHQQEGHMDFV